MIQKKNGGDKTFLAKLSICRSKEENKNDEEQRKHFVS
jgi:hypothetical protein